MATGAITNAEMNNSFLIDEYYENENKFLKNDDLFFEQKDSEHKETKDKKPTSAPKIIKTEISKELVHNNLIDFEIKNGKVEMKLTQSSFTTSELSILLEEIILINRLMYK